MMTARLLEDSGKVKEKERVLKTVEKLKATVKELESTVEKKADFQLDILCEFGGFQDPMDEVSTTR